MRGLRVRVSSALRKSWDASEQPIHLMSEFKSQSSLKRADYVSFALVAMLPSLVMWFLFQRTTGIRLEDALITYRYAENIALGNGFVFNPGERVLGTTTPLYTLILAALGFVFGTASIPVASSILSALLGQLAGFLTFATLRRMQVSRLIALGTSLLLLTQPEIVVSATGGMETMLVVALMSGSLYAFTAGSSRVAVALCALLVLTRIDGVVWTSVIFLPDPMARTRERPRADPAVRSDPASVVCIRDVLFRQSRPSQRCGERDGDLRAHCRTHSPSRT